MKLLIVESPAKSKTISKYLGKDFVVTASIGHVRDLPKSNKKAIDIEGGFIPHYEISPGKEDVIEEIKALAKKADEVYLATDPDREGEAIAWHIAEAVNLKKPKRVVFHEITKDAVLEAVEHPRGIDQNLRKAQEARRVLDRLVGYDLSGLIWKKVRYGLSAGRVQSPALRIVMEREREIRAFKKEAYYVISADLNAKDIKTLTFTCTEDQTEKNKAEEIIKKGEKGTWYVKSIEENQVKRAAKAPFTTSTLQQAASTRLGFSPSRTMQVAQKLYEAGHITYMRTDSTNLSQLALTQASQLIEKEYGKDFVQIKTFATKSKNAQEAHEAVRPTSLFTKSAGTTDDQKKLYKLIWQRAVASQMSEAVTLRTKVLANIKESTNEANSIPDFSLNGNKIVFEGWLKADPEGQGDEITLPNYNKDQDLNLEKISSEEKWTEPPPRYTEAGLIKELEKRGIGRPSTYASILRTIEEREYVTKEGKTLTPTDTGEVVSDFLENNFLHYINDTFTAEMEDKLDDIAEGKKEYEEVLTTFYKPFLKDVKSKEKMEKATNLGDADSKYKCPKCGGSMQIKLGKNGKFLSCAKYPDCDGALMMDGTEIKKDEPIGTDPETNLPIFLLNGKYGPYVQLGAYPEKTEKKKGEKVFKPRMASIPKEKVLTEVNVADAMKYLSLPKTLGVDPVSGKEIKANIGRFGPYVVLDGDFRSVKHDDIYSIDLKRALEILAEPKKPRGFAKKKKEN